ncbi:MAG: metalloregulator ArsR/SmtB family transcription factor [Candidatus Harrisonbacteria bacterium]|nr:metalloregulator ArsR/SmtB family transcription factor [Candidatus Harrisonbacteria bacterium]
MRESQVQSAAKILKLASDPTRFHILLVLMKSKGQLCVGEISQAITMSHSATSHQLAKLERAGIVHPVRKGQTVCYVLSNTAAASDIKKVILQLV